jgi:hypothetical protein
MAGGYSSVFTAATILLFASPLKGGGRLGFSQAGVTFNKPRRPE